jgi:multidrug efflux pump subunit AcrA (membrane-fusion protein)
MKNIISKKTFEFICWAAALIVFGVAVWYFYPAGKTNPTFARAERSWNTVTIKTAPDFSSIKIPAKVKSNSFAVISPRRAGIIQDLIVDVGDQVYKGQTIGSMLPEGVEGQSSAAINEASARLQKARAELANSKGVAVDSVSVATKQWRETNLQSQTQTSLQLETQKQLNEKKIEALLVATQTWENTKLVLFGAGNNNQSNRKVRGSFSDTILQNAVENKADEIQQMESSGAWNNPAKAVEHLSHLEGFFAQAESLYKNAQPTSVLSESTITANIGTIQAQQVRVSQIKQSILSLEEKNKQFVGVQAERVAGEERSREVLDLVQSQQNLTTTQAEKNVEVALAGYNAALVKSGHQSITSPFSGIVSARMVEVGQAVTMTQALFYLEGAQTARSQESLFEIHFDLPESWNNKIAVGAPVVLKTMEGESFEGKIFRLSPQINLNSNSLIATAIISDDLVELSHGQSLFVYVTASDSNIFTIPTLALKKRINAYYLWKMNEETPVQVQVEVIAEDGEFSQVFSRELKTDDSIISNPSVSLFKKSE